MRLRLILGLLFLSLFAGALAGCGDRARARDIPQQPTPGAETTTGTGKNPR